MKTVGITILLALQFIVIARLYFIKGYNEAQYDRKIANDKLQICLRTIYK